MAYQNDNSEYLHLQSRLRREYVGVSLSDVPTPAFIVDRKIFAENCAKMQKKAREWGTEFRAHVKTHKTPEGVRLQLQTTEGCSHSVVCSTIREAWEIANCGLVEDGVVNDILYGLPIAKNKIAHLSALRDKVAPYGGVVRILLDHPQQVRFLEEVQRAEGSDKRWSAFFKVQGGYSRAGLPPGSSAFSELLSVILNSPAVSLHGFYAHAGNSYSSTSLTQAKSYLSSELQMVNDAATIALEMHRDALLSGIHSQPLVLSVGSTPTAHASGKDAKDLLEREVHGKIELHAGNYPMLDLQQEHTSLIDYGCISQRVRATVVSYYPGRGGNGEDEALIDAGAIAFSKDTGPSGYYGEVVGKPWRLERMSQEHGILVCKDADDANAKLAVGDAVEIIGQHACLIAAAHPWYYIVEGGDQVVDVWVPWKGW